MPAYNSLFRCTLLVMALQTSVAWAEETVSTAAPVAAKTLATPQQDRISDIVIGRDLATLNAAQDRIAKLNNNGTEAENYFLVKAQAWLDFAMHEYY